MIKLSNINKSYGSLRVLRNFSAEFKNGITFLLGDTGQGKTTVLRIIMGLDKVDSGKVSIEGDSRISAVFQENRLLERLDINRNVEYVCGHFPEGGLVEAMQLEKYLGKPVCELSGGTKRRVALLRALSCSYDILLLDEPFTGMDEGIKQKAMDEVIKRSAHKTVIISTHDKYAIEYMGDDAKVIEVI